MATSPHSAPARPTRMKSLQSLGSLQHPIAALSNQEANGQTDEAAQVQSDDLLLNDIRPLFSSFPRKRKFLKQFFSCHNRIFTFRERRSTHASRSLEVVQPASTTGSSGLVHRQAQGHVPMSDLAQPSRTTLGILRRLSSTLSSLFAVRRQRGFDQPSQDDIDMPTGRRTIQTSIVLLDIAFSVAETVPLVGGPLKGALEALCKVLKLVDQKYQNVEGVGKLAERLATLMKTLSKLEAPDCEVLQLTDKLRGVELQLQSLLSKQRLRYAVVAQILADCRNDVNDCMQDFVTMTHVEMRAALIQVNKSARLAAECIAVIDPFGATQNIPKVNAGSIEMVAMMIQEIYSYNPKLKGALTNFVRFGMYELTMNNGRQIKAITSDVLLCLDKGAKLVMNVVVVMHTEKRESIRCPTCQEVIPASQENRSSCIPCDGMVSTVKALEVQSSPGPQPERSNSDLSWFRRITIHEILVSQQYLPSAEESDEVEGGIEEKALPRSLNVLPQVNDSEPIKRQRSKKKRARKTQLSPLNTGLSTPPLQMGSLSPDSTTPSVDTDRMARWDEVEDCARALQASGYPSTFGEAGYDLFRILRDILSTRKTYRRFLQYRSEMAQLLVNALQWILEYHPSLDGPQRRALLMALCRLAQRNLMIPEVYRLRDIEIKGLVFQSSSVDVFRGTYQGRVLCLKRYRASAPEVCDEMTKMSIKESVLWYNNRHTGILPFEGIFQNGANIDRAYLASPFLENGTVSDFLKLHPDRDRRLLVRDIFSAIAFLHSNRIVHGDIKARNVLVNDYGRAVLADLSLSRLNDAEILTWTSIQITDPFYGTLPWLAPEVLQMQYPMTPTSASDIYALGCFIYEVFTGWTPFWEVVQGLHYLAAHRIVTEVIRGRRPLKPLQGSDPYSRYGLTDDIWSMMEDCWVREVKLRPTAQNLLQRSFLSNLTDPRPSDPKV